MRKRSCGERQRVICTGQRALMIAGVVLVAAGLIVLLLCIPAWRGRRCLAWRWQSPGWC